MEHKIYLDNNSTTVLDPNVYRAILAVMEESYANPSSLHTPGKKVRSTLNKSREIIAKYLNVKPGEIVFTSGATEAANMLLKGTFSDCRGHLITSVLEHPCVFQTAEYLQNKGVEVTFLQPGQRGAATPEQVRQAIQNHTKAIILMAANNETGIKTDIEAIAKIADEHKIPFFVDGVALLGKEIFTIPQGVSAMFFSGHKLHAPKGIGFVYLGKRVKLDPLLIGGGQEGGRRCGTENILGIVALAKAMELLNEELPAASERMKYLRDKLETGVLTRFPCARVNSSGQRICNTTNISFSGQEGEMLLAKLDLAGVYVSHGSACSSGALEPSRVLLNMGIPMELAQSAIRFSLSRYTTEDEIDLCLQILEKILT